MDQHYTHARKKVPNEWHNTNKRVGGELNGKIVKNINIDVKTIRAQS